MALAPVCSECGTSLAGKKKSTRTCGEKCRKARSIRLRTQHARDGEWENDGRQENPETAEMRLAIRSELDDRIHKVLDQELTPLVREAITDDVLRSITALLALTPQAVAAIMDDLMQTESYDRRQKAYTLLLKYTAGNSPLVPSVDPKPPAVNVIFPGMERPDAPIVTAAELLDDDEFICNACDRALPMSEQAAPGAERCKECHAALQVRKDEIVKGLPAST